MRDYLETIIALSMVPKMGSQRIRTLLKKVDYPGDIFRLTEQEIISVPGIGSKIAEGILRFNDWQRVENIISQIQRNEVKIVNILNNDYPALLNEIYDPPLLLYAKGNTDILNTQSVAVVGTRKTTAYGRDMAEYFTGQLVHEGLTIISGLAYGIDTIAHKTCVDNGGKTIAVLGSGIDVIYPHSNEKLACKIIDEGGVVISEFPLGTLPDAPNFPTRNRIVSGLSLGTIVIESALKGGSMITAKLALDQNREVFVIPHLNTNRQGEGCNYLIKRGMGKLVQTVDDILVELPVPLRAGGHPLEKSDPKKWQSLELNDRCRRICQILEENPVHIDVLCEKLNVSPETILVDLFELEMMDCVIQEAGKKFRLK